MKIVGFSVAVCLGLASCTRDAANPNALAPENSYATWSPMQGGHLISSRYCQTLLPETFGKDELSLAELIDIGLLNNPATKVTWAQARAAAGSYGQSLSAYYPNVQFSGTYTRERTSVTNFGGPPLVQYYTTMVQPEIMLTYTLFDFGQRSSAAEEARQALYFADWTHNQQIQTTLQTIMDDYYQYLYQKAILVSDEADLENAQASLDAANQRFALGLAALGDVAQARTQYLQNKINLTSQKQAVENAFAQLAVDLGLPADVPFKVQPMPEQVCAGPLLDGVAVLVDRAQRQRQDLLAAQANVHSLEAAVENAKAQRYPVVNGTFDIGKTFYSTKLHESYDFTAEVAISFPLFRGYYYRNGIRIAKANLEQGKAEMLQTELALIQGVTTAHMNVKTTADNLHFTEDYLQAAILEFDIALKSYKAGTMTILDVLSAQSSLADARTKKAQAQYGWFTALASIAYATGSLCSPPCEMTGEPPCP